VGYPWANYTTTSLRYNFHMPAAISALKQQLRQQCKTIRKELGEQRRKQASDAMAGDGRRVNQNGGMLKN
jgi:hypothetical protein